MSLKIKFTFKIITLTFLFLCVSISKTLSQNHTYQGHSHNDYKRNIPFHDAFDAGILSFEIDVIYKKGELYISHLPINPFTKKKFKEIYLVESILNKIENLPNDMEVIFLIDVKNKPKKCLESLRLLFSQKEDLFVNTCTKNSGRIKLIITGKKPLKNLSENDLCFLFFDVNLLQKHERIHYDNIGMVSSSLKVIKSANKKTNLNSSKILSEKAKKLNVPFRIWGIPQDKEAWKKLITNGVNLLNVDDLKLFRKFQIENI